MFIVSSWPHYLKRLVDALLRLSFLFSSANLPYARHGQDSVLTNLHTSNATATWGTPKQLFQVYILIAENCKTALWLNLIGKSKYGPGLGEPVINEARHMGYDKLVAQRVTGLLKHSQAEMKWYTMAPRWSTVQTIDRVLIAEHPRCTSQVTSLLFATNEFPHL